MRRQQARHAADVDLVECRLARQQLVRSDAYGQHVALRCVLAGAHAAGFGHLPRAADAAFGRLGTGRFEAGPAQRAAVADDHQEELRVAVRRAGLVRIRQALQCLRQQLRGVGCGQPLRRQAVAQGRASVGVVGDERPVLVQADLDGRRQVRVVQTRRHAHRVLPLLAHRRAGRWLAGQHQHQVLAAARVGDQPGHQPLALAEQPQQLEAAEVAHGRGWRRRGGLV